jgi:hypothetical protein
MILSLFLLPYRSPRSGSVTFKTNYVRRVQRCVQKITAAPPPVGTQ